jgi:hypothetical protein
MKLFLFPVYVWNCQEKGNCSPTSWQSEPKTVHESTPIHAFRKKFRGLDHFQTHIIKAKII